MSTSLLTKALRTSTRRLLSSPPLSRRFASVASAEAETPPPQSSSTFTFNDRPTTGNDTVCIKAPTSGAADGGRSSPSTVTMPLSFMSGSVVGRRFYNEVTTRPADDGNGWTVMLDYRTLKTPSKRALKLPTLGLAKAVAAEWAYQETDGIRPFTMPLMKLACTALERVPITRPKIIDYLVKKFNQDLVFCRAPEDGDLTRDIYEKQVEKLDPLLDWVKSEFGFRPVVHSSFFGGRQEDGLVKAVENLLKNTNDCELASIDAIASAAHSLIIAIAMFRGKLDIDQAIELIRLEEDLQVDKWGLVEGGHDLDIADLRVQIASAIVFLGLSKA